MERGTLMPVLHKYRDGDGHYVLTSIKGAMVTFHLTPGGQERLLSAGIREGENFKRGLLLDLFRSGDAYTGETGPGKITERIGPTQQKLFDHGDDPDPEGLFPTCGGAGCSSSIGLHLVEIKEEEHIASILCVDCRLLKSKWIDTSIPLQLVNRAVLNHILGIKRIRKIDPSVTAYRELLEIQFKARWDDIARSKSRTKMPSQEALFNASRGKQGKLI
jgi:hypothetical protein